MGAGAVGRVGEDEAGTLKAQLAALMQQTTHSAVIVLQVDQPQKVESIDTTQDKPRFKKHSFAPTDPQADSARPQPPVQLSC